MTKVIIATAKNMELNEPIRAKDWFLKENYEAVKTMAKFVLANKPDTTPRNAARDLLSGKYSSQKDVNADLKLVTDHAIVIARSIQKAAKNN